MRNISEVKESQSPTEYATIRIEEVQMLRYLEGLKLVVDTLMENLIESDLVIFKMRYLEAGATWEDVAEKLNKTTRYINSRRKVIAKRFVELKGY
jgi:phage transcriptional regulator, rinA family protein